MIGTIRDKYEYLGEGSCNEMEKSFIPLTEHRPFRSFSPIGLSPGNWYPDTKRCFQAAEEAAAAEGIASSGKMYELIYHRIREATKVYGARCYDNTET